MKCETTENDLRSILKEYISDFRCHIGVMRVNSGVRYLFLSGLVLCEECDCRVGVAAV